MVGEHYESMASRPDSRTPLVGTEQQSVESSHEDSRDALSLQPFHGFFTPGICFTSGYCLCLYKWSSSPTVLDAYESIFVLTPNGGRRLYADPAEAGPYVETYHEFDRTCEATTTWTQATEEGMELHLEGNDGTRLHLRADLGTSAGTRLLTAITSLTPTPMLRTSLGEAISNLSFGLLIAANGLKVVGRTDTHEPYRVEADSLRTVTGASATLNGEDLGDVCSPDRPLGFGDARVPNVPLFAFGDLYLRPPSE